MKSFATKLAEPMTLTGRLRVLRRAKRAEEQIREQIRMSFVTDEEFAQWVLRGHERQWSGCTACELCEDRTNVCYGEGRASPIMVVIAEAPGEQEDLYKRTLYGPAGTVFRKACHAVGIDLARYAYLTNMVICRPPGNRKPSRLEREACQVRLLQQLEVLKPVIILLLGKSAMKLLQDVPSDFRVADYRGRIPSRHWPALGLGASNLKLVFGTYHPSFPLRQQTKQKKRMKLQLIIEDLKRVKKVIDLVAGRRNG